MKCLTAFVKGTDNFKLDAVGQHETSKSHVYHSAKFKPKIIDKKSEAEQSYQQIIKSEYDRLAIKFINAHAVAMHHKGTI